MNILALKRKKIYYYDTGIIMFNYVSNQCPDYFENSFNKIHYVSKHKTKHVPTKRTDIRDLSWNSEGIIVWNSITGQNFHISKTDNSVSLGWPFITKNINYCTFSIVSCKSRDGNPHLSNYDWHLVGNIMSFHGMTFSWNEEDEDATFQIARFMGPIWGPPGADRSQVGPVLAQWTLLSVDVTLPQVTPN